MIFQYLNNQKEWIFSGIGITILLAFCSIIKLIIAFIMKRYRLKKTSRIHFLNTLPYPLYHIQNDELNGNDLTPEFIENCSIKNHSHLLKKLKKRLVEFDYLIWIDIDKFTQINNLFGRECGNQVVDIILKLLFSVSQKLDCECKIYHAVGRDEFFIVISNGFSVLSLRECAQEFIFNINQFTWSKIVPNMFITCSAGISKYKKNSMDTIKRAKASLDLAKTKNGGNIGPEILRLHPYKLIDLSSS